MSLAALEDDRGASPLSEAARRYRIPISIAVSIVGLLVARPTEYSIMLGSGIAFMGLVYRALAAGQIRKNEQLAVGGPYALSRNPLYFGSFVIAIGFGIACGSVVVLVIAVALFLAMYASVIDREEAELRALFGASFDQYAAAVPRILPREFSLRRAFDGFSMSIYWKNREYNALLGYCGAVGLLVLLMRLHGASSASDAIWL